MSRNGKIFVAGHRGLVGSALVRRLGEAGRPRLVLRSRDDLDLTDRVAVERFFREEKPEYVFLAAARVGGIQANSAAPADFIRVNLQIQTSIIPAAHLAGTRRLMFFGSTCLFPRDCPQPMKEEQILSGPMEPTSEAYSVAKLAGFAMCEAYNRQHGTEFVTVIPATLYGPRDNFDPESGHVLSSLIRRFHDHRGKPRITLWGTGRAVREFLYADDLADACVRVLFQKQPPPQSPINVGSGEGISIRDLAGAIASVVGFRGEIDFDAAKPDGAPSKVLDSSRIRALGWAPRTPLAEGLRKAYQWFLRPT